MKEPLSVTDADLLDAFKTLHYDPKVPEVKPREPVDDLDEFVMTRLRIVLQNDRHRVLERENQ